MLSKKIEKILNDQIQLEAESSHLYLAMASWAEVKGFAGVSEFMYSHAEEERQHMLKLIRFINERGGSAGIPKLEEPPKKFESVKSLFKLLLEQEEANTQHVHEIVHLALDAKDYNTHNFMQWYVAEQMEEEALAQTVIEKLELAGDAPGGGFYLFDRDLPSLKAKFTAQSDSAE